MRLRLKDRIFIEAKQYYIQLVSISKLTNTNIFEC